MNNTHTDSLSFEQIIDSHLNLITRLIHQAQRADSPTTQHFTFLLSLQSHYQTHIDHLFDSLTTLTAHQRHLLNLIPTTPLPPPPLPTIKRHSCRRRCLRPTHLCRSFILILIKLFLHTIPQRTPWPSHRQSRKPHFPPTQTLQVLRYPVRQNQQHHLPQLDRVRPPRSRLP